MRLAYSLEAIGGGRGEVVARIRVVRSGGLWLVNVGEVWTNVFADVRCGHTTSFVGRWERRSHQREDFNRIACEIRQ
jgi:hypothetical protein